MGVKFSCILVTEVSVTRNVLQVLLALTLAVCGFSTAGLSAQSTDKDMLQMQHYALTMPNVTHFWQTVGALGKVAKDHPELKDVLATDADKHEDLAAIEKRTASNALVKAAITEQGLTVHDFVMTELTLLQAALGSAMIPPGPDRAKKALEANINPANLDFVDKHKAELEALQAKNVPKEDGGA